MQSLFYQPSAQAPAPQSRVQEQPAWLRFFFRDFATKAAGFSTGSG
jgi:hypothetical protein